jgi:BRCA1-associated protein
LQGLLAAQAKDADVRVVAAEEEAGRAVAAGTRADEAERKRQATEKKLADATASLQAQAKEADFLRSLNETLLKNQVDFATQAKDAKAQLAAKDEQIKDLQEQVRDVMLFFEAQRVIEASGEDLSSASAVPGPERQPLRKGKGKAGK